QLDVSDDLLHLARLQSADEMPAQPSRRARHLLEQILCAVLADQRHAGLRESLDVVRADVLDGRQDVDLAAISPRARRGTLDPRPHGRQVPAHQLDAQRSHANAPWRPVAAPSRRCEKNLGPGAQIVQSLTSRTVPTPAAPTATGRQSATCTAAAMSARAVTTPSPSPTPTV